MNFSEADDPDRIARYLRHVIAGLARNDDFDDPDVRYDEYTDRIVVSTAHKPTRTEVRHGFGDDKLVLGFARDGDVRMLDVRYDTPYHRIPDIVHSKCEGMTA